MGIKKRRGLLLAGLLIMTLILGICVGGMALIRFFTTSPLRRALPATAVAINEWQWSEGGPAGQDYIYLLSARISEEQFREYVARLNMTPHTPEREYSPGFVLHWYPHELYSRESLAWWQPSHGSDGVYIFDGGSWWSYAKWENGYIYVVSYNI